MMAKTNKCLWFKRTHIQVIKNASTNVVILTHMMNTIMKSHINAIMIMNMTTIMWILTKETTK